eukprot:2304990-Pyramimonas_sp.AAC.1
MLQSVATLYLRVSLAAVLFRSPLRSACAFLTSSAHLRSDALWVLQERAGECRFENARCNFRRRPHVCERSLLECTCPFCLKARAGACKPNRPLARACAR